MSRIRETNNGQLSDLNSSNIPLGAGAIFTGQAEDVTEFVEVRVAVYSDVASNASGLSIEFSVDGVNWDHTDTYQIPAYAAKNYVVQRVARYFRIVYVNGPVAQGDFRLSVIFNRVAGVPSSHRTDSDIISEDDAALGISILKTVGSDPTTFHTVDAQHPLPADGDSLYLKDIDVVNSDNGGFIGEVTDYFDSLKSVNVDTSNVNPKVIKIWFNRTTQMHGIGFGCDDLTKSFSNIVFKALGSGESVRYIKDESADSTKRNSYFIKLPRLALNGFIIEFHTTDEVGLSNIFMPKTIDTHSTLSATRDDGEVIDLGATNNDNLKVSLQEYGDTPSVDAFARLRVSEPFTLFDSKQTHDKQPLFFDESLGGVATSVHSAVDANTAMTVTAAVDDFVIRQTKQRLNYQPGKSQLTFMTFHAPQETGVTKRLGLFDGTGTNFLTPYNGVFLQIDGTNISWNIAKNGVVTETVTQDNWNVDRLNGEDPSALTLDLTAAQIAIIDFEWLGVGRVRVGFVIDGLIYYVHNFNHANNASFDSVYMSTANLPVRYDITSDGTGGGTLDHICASVISEGGLDETGILRAIDTGLNYVTGLAGNTDHALIGIKLKAAYYDITIIPDRVSVIMGTNDDFRWSLQLNPTINGVFTYADVTNSAVQRAVGTASNTVATPGEILASGLSNAVGNIDTALKTALRLGSTIAGVQDELVLCVAPFGANASTAVSLNFRELL